MVTSAQHDAGAWDFYTDHDRTVYVVNCMPPDGVDPDDYIAVAETYDATDTDEANARLMAASPDLLAACREALAWLNRFGEHSPITVGGEAELADTLAAAIGKAEQD